MNEGGNRKEVSLSAHAVWALLIAVFIPGSVLAQVSDTTFSFFPSQPFHAPTYDSAYEYSYDANGSMTRETSRRGGTRTYSYTPFNKVEEVHEEMQRLISYSYDASNNRSAEKDAEGYISGRYFGSIEEQNGNRSLYFMFGGRRIGVRRANAGIEFLHQDHLGNVASISNGMGERLSKRDYYECGAFEAESGPVSNEPHSYNDKRLNKLTENHYFEARTYRSKSCRFLQADTVIPNLFNPQSPNRYAFVRNNPLKYVDPTGHVAWDLGPVLDIGDFGWLEGRSGLEIFLLPDGIWNQNGEYIKSYDFPFSAAETNQYFNRLSWAQSGAVLYLPVGIQGPIHDKDFWRETISNVETLMYNKSAETHGVDISFQISRFNESYHNFELNSQVLDDRSQHANLARGGKGFLWLNPRGANAYFFSITLGHEMAHTHMRLKDQYYANVEIAGELYTGKMGYLARSAIGKFGSTHSLTAENVDRLEQWAGIKANVGDKAEILDTYRVPGTDMNLMGGGSLEFNQDQLLHGISNALRVSSEAFEYLMLDR